MHKNRLIQQKIIALKKETSEFVATIMNNPENRKRYIDHIRMYGPTPQPQLQNVENAPLQLEPKVWINCDWHLNTMNEWTNEWCYFVQSEWLIERLLLSYLAFYLYLDLVYL